MNDQPKSPETAKAKKQSDTAGAQSTTNDKSKIEKPKVGFLDKFKSKKKPEIAGVQAGLSPLPIKRIADVGDWAWLFPDEDIGWTPELCFVDVPIIGEKFPILHTIDEDLAVQHLSAKQIKRHRLALATMPGNKFFFCIVPSQNLENSWNKSAIEICQRAKTEWMQALSRKAEGVDNYQPKATTDPDPFPEIKWPITTLEGLEGLLAVTFKGLSIETDDHPGLLRLIGKKQNLS